MNETWVFNLKITLWTLYDVHGIPKWQEDHFYSQEHETGAKNLIIYVWQILISLKGETPFIHGRNELQNQCSCSLCTSLLGRLQGAGVALASRLHVLLKRCMRK